MAAVTSRATPPPTAERFSALESAPRTPSSLAPPPATHNASSGVAHLPRPSTSQTLAFSSIDLSPKTDRAQHSPARSPVPLTGAAAIADAKRRKQQHTAAAAADSRHTSSNPAVQAMQSLMGAGGISKPDDAPAPDKLSEPMRKAAEKITLPDTSTVPSDSPHPSPTSLSSFATMDSTVGHSAAMTATATAAAAHPPHTSASHFVAEPAQMLEPSSYAHHRGSSTGDADADKRLEEEANKAFSYPGPPALRDHNHDSGPARGMSLPGVGQAQASPRSPASSTKKHKCPYCLTQFTRHHNLKSHLLTHSHEKPYVCQTCHARFRRLHDLKRHTKLHTGERPHTCDKCGRRFARGDALARHNKGPGGCAGRRSSFGADEDGMDGVEYTGDDDDPEDDDDDATDAQGRRVSEPSRKRAHIEMSHDQEERSIYSQHSSTYPPAAHRRVGDMGPPVVVHPGSGSGSGSGGTAATSPRDLSTHSSQAQNPSLGSSYYGAFNQHGTGGMTESPKPLSPGQVPDQHRLAVDPGGSTTSSLPRNRSPSLTTQFQQAHFGRGGTGGRTPPQPQPAQFPAAPQLPPLSLASASSSSAQSRPGLQLSSLAGPGPSMLHHQQVPPPTGGVSNPGSASSHGRSSGSSMREILGGGGPGPGGGVTAGSAGGEAEIWTHVRSLEVKFSRMQDEYELRISRLQEELISLKGQLAGAGGAGVGGPSVGHYGEPRY